MPLRNVQWWDVFRKELYRCEDELDRIHREMASGHPCKIGLQIGECDWITERHLILREAVLAAFA